MPKVFQQNGFNCFVYTLDHSPPHVHIFHGEFECVLTLGNSKDEITILDRKNMKNRELKLAKNLLKSHWAKAMKVWNEIHD